MKRTDKLTTFTALLLFLAFIAYAGVYAVRTLTDRTVTADVTAASVSVGGTASGIVIRDETVLTSTRAYVDILAADGEKISANGVLAMEMSSETGLERAGRMRELELEIERVSTALSGLDSAGDLTERDDKLRRGICDLTRSVARHELSEIDSTVLNLRALVFGEGGEATQQQLDALKNELLSLKNSSSSDTRDIRAPESGTFSSKVDGYEHLTSSDISNLTPTRIRSLIDSQKTPPDGAFGKLITEYYWYFAGVMSAEDAANLSPGAYASLDFGRYYGEKASAVVISISETEAGNVAVVFRMDSALADTLGMREATASVLFSEYDGLRVPEQAVHLDEDGETTYVWAVTAMQLERKDVAIIYAGDGFYLVSRGSASNSLRAGNTVVVSGKDLYEGKLMD